MVDYLRIENVAYWNMIHACSALSSEKKVDRDPIAMLMYLYAAFENKFRVDFRETEELGLGELMAKYGNRLSPTDLEFIDKKLRPLRNIAVHRNIIPPVLVIYSTFRHAIMILTKGIRYFLNELGVEIRYRKDRFGVLALDYTDESIERLCSVGLLHKFLIPENRIDYGILRTTSRIIVSIDEPGLHSPKKRHRKIRGKTEKLMTDLAYIFASPLLLLSSTPRIVDLGAIIGQLNRIRNLYRASFIYRAVEEGQVRDVESYIDYLIHYDLWMDKLPPPSEPHKVELTLEAIVYDAFKLCKWIYVSKIKRGRNTQQFLEKFRSILRFLTRRIPSYLLEHRRDSFENGIRFGFFLKMKWILEIENLVSSISKKLNQKIYDEHHTKLRELTTLKPYLVSEVFRALPRME